MDAMYGDGMDGIWKEEREETCRRERGRRVGGARAGHTYTCIVHRNQKTERPIRIGCAVVCLCGLATICSQIMVRWEEWMRGRGREGMGGIPQGAGYMLHGPAPEGLADPSSSSLPPFPSPTCHEMGDHLGRQSRTCQEVTKDTEQALAMLLRSLETLIVAGLGAGRHIRRPACRLGLFDSERCKCISVSVISPSTLEARCASVLMTFDA